MWLTVKIYLAKATVSLQISTRSLFKTKTQINNYNYSHISWAPLKRHLCMTWGTLSVHGITDLMTKGWQLQEHLVNLNDHYDYLMTNGINNIILGPAWNLKPRFEWEGGQASFTGYPDKFSCNAKDWDGRLHSPIFAVLEEKLSFCGGVRMADNIYSCCFCF